jgi:hypothetical protein
MCCKTKNNMIILFELSLIKSNHMYAEIKYKNESGAREMDFESFLVIILTDGDGTNEASVELACR